LDADELVGLSEELLCQGGVLVVQGHGGSMYPCLRDGDVLTVRPIGQGRAEVGDVVLHRSAAGRPCVHRVVARRDGGRVVVRGDAAEGAGETVAACGVLGAVVEARRGNRRLRIRARTPGPLRRTLIRCRRLSGRAGKKVLLRLRALLPAGPGSP
jgi:hypothetical protein